MEILSVSRGALCATALAVGLGACGGVSDVQRERVARSETSVQQAEQTIGTSEMGAIELQQAKDNLGQARQALDDSDGAQAERLARQAELDAELAIAKAQSARARRAAQELQTGIQMLRREAGRTPAGSEPDTTDTDIPRSETTPPED